MPSFLSRTLTTRHRTAPAAAALLAIASSLPGTARALCARPETFPGAGAEEGAAASPRQAVLTFDAAWSADGAPEILDTLARLQVSATFFLAGRFVAEHPSIARRIVSEGHEVGNHTWHHGHLTEPGEGGLRVTLPGLSAAGLLTEMEATRRQIIATTGVPPLPIWRAPYGEINREILEWTRRSGYTHVGWSEGLDTLDWVSDRSSPLYQPPERAARRILSRLARRPPGAGAAVILMHLGSTREAADRFVNALPALIEGCRALGYRLVTVGQTASGDRLP